MSQYAQTPLEKNAIKARLAEVYAWDLSLALNEKRQYRESVNVIFKAFILQPHNLKYLKATISISVKWLLFKLKIIKF
jgi:hypothetical protein